MELIKITLPMMFDECPQPWQNMVRHLSKKFTNKQWERIAEKKIDEEMKTCKGRVIRTNRWGDGWFVEFSNQHDYMQWFLKWG